MGVCYLKRPHFLKCEYKDKNQKQLIVNRNNLVIYHKRYYHLSHIKRIKGSIQKSNYSNIKMDRYKT